MRWVQWSSLFYDSGFGIMFLFSLKHLRPFCLVAVIWTKRRHKLLALMQIALWKAAILWVLLFKSQPLYIDYFFCLYDPALRVCYSINWLLVTADVSQQSSLTCSSFLGDVLASASLPRTCTWLAYSRTLTPGNTSPCERKMCLWEAHLWAAEWFYTQTGIICISYSTQRTGPLNIRCEAFPGSSGVGRCGRCLGRRPMTWLPTSTESIFKVNYRVQCLQMADWCWGGLILKVYVEKDQRSLP